MTIGVRRVGFASRSGITAPVAAGQGGTIGSVDGSPGLLEPAGRWRGDVGVVLGRPRGPPSGGRCSSSRRASSGSSSTPGTTYIPRTSFQPGRRRRAGTGRCTCRCALSIRDDALVRLVVGVEDARAPARPRTAMQRVAVGAFAQERRPAARRPPSPRLLPADEPDDRAAVGDEDVAVDVQRGRSWTTSRADGQPVGGLAGKPPPSRGRRSRRGSAAPTGRRRRGCRGRARRRAGTSRSPAMSSPHWRGAADVDPRRSCPCPCRSPGASARGRSSASTISRSRPPTRQELRRGDGRCRRPSCPRGRRRRLACACRSIR